MKLKLFFVSILVLLSFVGYKTYIDTKALKSIDSYESCIASKGSVIQESYPATCITRLGSRFIQSTLKTFNSLPYKFSINYPAYADLTTQKYSDGTEYYTLFNSGENQQPFMQILLTSEKIISGQSLKDYITKKYKIFDGYTHFGSAPSKVIEFSHKNIDNHEAYLIINEQKLNSEFNGYKLFVRLNDQAVLIIDPGVEPQTQEDRELFNQILSTFHFLD